MKCRFNIGEHIRYLSESTDETPRSPIVSLKALISVESEIVNGTKTKQRGRAKMVIEAITI